LTVPGRRPNSEPQEYKQPLVELRRILGVTRGFEMIGRIGPLIEKNDLTDAMALAESALKASPEDDLALVATADISLRQGNKAAALKAIERAIASNPAQKGQLSATSPLPRSLTTPSSSASSSDFRSLISPSKRMPLFAEEGIWVDAVTGLSSPRMSRHIFSADSHPFCHMSS
jgi:hypothetical protein